VQQIKYKMTIQIGGGLLGLSGSQAIGGVLPPLMTPTTTLEQAVRNDTLGIGYAGRWLT
jgi:hypothetical protein